MIDTMVDQASAQHLRMMQLQRDLTAAELRLSLMRVDLEHLLSVAGLYMGEDITDQWLHQSTLQAAELFSMYRTYFRASPAAQENR